MFKNRRTCYSICTKEYEFTLQIQIEDTKVDEEKNVEDNAVEDWAENAKGAVVDYLIDGCLVKLLRTAV